jgi:hypothetical protein
MKLICMRCGSVTEQLLLLLFLVTACSFNVIVIFTFDHLSMLVLISKLAYLFVLCQGIMI